MKPAGEIQWLNARAAYWEQYDSKSRVDCSSSGLRLDTGWYLFDPIPLEPSALEELLTGDLIAAVCCTSTNHERACVDFVRLSSCRLLSSVETASEFGWTNAEIISEGSLIDGEIEVVQMTGAAPGEVAFVDTAHQHAIVGDAIVNLPATGLALLPDKYCTNPRALRDAIRNLLHYPLKLLTLAHGSPLVGDVNVRLAALLS